MPETASSHSPSILICFAMYAEADKFIQSLNAEEQKSRLHPCLPMRLFAATVNSMQIHILTSGVDRRHGEVDNIGCEPAAIMAYEGLRVCAPDLVISAGTAGGFKKRGGQVGKVYLSEKSILFHDRHVPLPGFAESAMGAYPCVNASELAKALELPTGFMSSGSSLRKLDSDLEILEKYAVVAKEMEAAAVAWVASLFATPFLAIKSITNLVDEHNQSEDEFLSNFDIATASLHVVLCAFLAWINEAKLRAWKQEILQGKN